jgi:UDP-2,3-diacylglucosamine pyrophosphatase LpxH
VGITSCEKIDLRSAFISYQTVNERFEESMQWNKKNPLKEIKTSNEEYTIFIMGDSHIGGVENYQLFTKNAIQSKALALVMVGDITTGRVKDYETLSQNIPPKDSIASFLMVGNHEIYFDGWKEFYARFGSSTYYFRVETPEASDLFICLDSGSGTLGDKQMQWLKNLLKSKREYYRYCIVFTHVNFFRTRHTGSTNPVIEELQTLMDLFYTYNVNSVIMGHDHIKSIEKLGNTSYITLDALLDGFSQAGYLELIINNQSANYKFVNL